MRDVTDLVARQDERLRRITIGEAARAARQRRRERAVGRVGRRALRIALALAAVWLGVFVVGLLGVPVGTTGLLLAMLASVLLTVLLLVFPRGGAADANVVAKAPPAALPQVTDAWLDGQRRALPQLAAPQVDAISARLALLEPQLGGLAATDPVAQDLNRLLGKHLPELVESYVKVPAPQRQATPEGGGPSIETRLIDGLGVIESELGRVSERLAAGDRDAFLSKGKFLENRYGQEPGL